MPIPSGNECFDSTILFVPAARSGFGERWLAGWQDARRMCFSLDGDGGVMAG